jgi:hypothetical protein
MKRLGLIVVGALLIFGAPGAAMAQGWRGGGGGRSFGGGGGHSFAGGGGHSFAGGGRAPMGGGGGWRGGFGGAARPGYGFRGASGGFRGAPVNRGFAPPAARYGYGPRYVPRYGYGAHYGGRPFFPARTRAFVPGYWGFRGGARLWIGSSWVLPPYEGWMWVAGQWVWNGYSWVWQDGYWAPPY